MSRWLVFLAVAIVALAAQQPALAENVPATPVDPEACDDGTIVAGPTNNTELVADCRVLAGLKETLEGTSNVRRRLEWSATKSLSEWEGISVGGSPRRVTVIELDSSAGTPTAPQWLRGEVPAALGSLTGLVTIDLQANLLTGTIPPELGNLPNLKTLDLGYNRLRGAWNYDDPRNPYLEPGIPPELGNLKETLQHLDLGGNNLTGDIPPEIWGLTELRTLRLHANNNINGGTGLTGTIPAEVKNLTKLNQLQLHGNAFSGPIPTEIAQLSELTSLTLYGNGFTGTIPPGLGRLPLTLLHLNSNQLTGSIPSELEDLVPGLTSLLLIDNSFSGCVPPLLLEVPRNDLEYMLDNYDIYGLVLCGTNANTPPSLSSATVNGDTLTLTYNEALDTGSQPDTRDYEVTVNDSTSDHAVTAVLVDGRTVKLTLEPAVVASDTVLVSYTWGTNPVRDPAGARAGTLTDEVVTNNTPPDPPLYKSGAVDGYTLTLTYDEDLDLYSQPEPSAYTVTVNGSDHGVSSVYVNGSTVELDLPTPVLAGQTVRLSYLPPQEYPLQDLDGEIAAQLDLDAAPCPIQPIVRRGVSNRVAVFELHGDLGVDGIELLGVRRKETPAPAHLRQRLKPGPKQHALRRQR